MRTRYVFSAILSLVFTSGAAPPARAQAGAETFAATAVVKTAAGAMASAPVSIVVDRKMSEAEAGRLTSAFNAGGLPALRKALVGVAPTGSIRLGSGTPTASRILIERVTDKGRLLTIVTDEPILFLGAGVASAKSKAGYDMAVLDIEVDAKGNGAGMLSPAAKVTVKQGVFVVEDYASELIRLTDVKKVK